jgi:CBS domain-containing protein
MADLTQIKTARGTMRTIKSYCGTEGSIMGIGDICTRNVMTIGRDATIAQAAARMRQYGVGDLLVVERMNGGRLPVGIVTDRDVTVEVIALELDPAQATVGSIAGDRLLTAREDEGIFEALRAMSDKGMRRAPVIDHRGRLTGIVSIDDMLALLAAELARIARIVRRGPAGESARSGDLLVEKLAA